MKSIWSDLVSFMDLVNIKILSRVTCWLKLLVSLSGPKVGPLFFSLSLSLSFGGDVHQHS